MLRHQRPERHLQRDLRWRYEHLRRCPFERNSKIWVISTIIVEVDAVHLSVMSVVGKYACLLITSINTFATLIADASVRG